MYRGKDVKFGQRMMFSRELHNISKTDAAKLIGISLSQYSRYENGYNNHIIGQKIITIADAVKCSPLYLLGLSDNIYEKLDPKFRQSK